MVGTAKFRETHPGEGWPKERWVLSLLSPLRDPVCSNFAVLPRTGVAYLRSWYNEAVHVSPVNMSVTRTIYTSSHMTSRHRTLCDMCHISKRAEFLGTVPIRGRSVGTSKLHFVHCSLGVKTELKVVVLLLVFYYFRSSPKRIMST